MPDRRCPEHFKSTQGRLLDVGSLTCVAVDAELQHWGYLGITQTVSDNRESSSRRVLQLEWLNRLSFIFLIYLSTHGWCCITHICTQGLFKCMKAILLESFALNIFWEIFCSTFSKEEDRPRVQHPCSPVLSTTAVISIQWVERKGCFWGEFTPFECCTWIVQLQEQGKQYKSHKKGDFDKSYILYKI